MNPNKPDFKYKDRVGEITSDWGNDIYIVESEPIFKKGQWYMQVIQDKIYHSSEFRLCEDFALIKRPEPIIHKPKIDFNKLKVGVPKMKLTKPAIITLVVLSVLLLIGLWTGGNYNSLVTGRNGVDNSWSKVETQYQRRLDVVDNLVSSVKGAQGQEQKVFGDIAKARSQYNQATNADDKAAAASSIETNVALIPKLQEAYPELKSNATVQSLMSQLTSTEDGIATKRDAYNDVVTNYNNNVSRFPKSIFAGLFGFEKRTLFKADPQASKAPKVDFN